MPRITVEMVMGLLRDLMREGPVPAQVAVRRAKEMGANLRTLGAARRRLGVRFFRDGGKWFWSLKGTAGPGGCTLAPLHSSALPPCTLR